MKRRNLELLPNVGYGRHMARRSQDNNLVFEGYSLYKVQVLENGIRVSYMCSIF